VTETAALSRSRIGRRSGFSIHERLAVGSFVERHATRDRLQRSERAMRYVHLYLVGYFLLVAGALAALWYGGVLQQIAAMWVLIGLIIAVGLGVMLAISAGKPEITRE
jgi:hypothetical protein